MTRRSLTTTIIIIIIKIIVIIMIIKEASSRFGRKFDELMRVVFHRLRLAFSAKNDPK